MNENPYAAPMAELSAANFSGAERGAGGGLAREGGAVIVTTGTVLPRRCVLTNQPITDEDYRDRDLVYAPQWILVLFFIGGPFIMLVVYMLTRKKCRLLYGLHPEVRRKIRQRKIIGTLLLLAAAGAFVAAYYALPALAALGTLALLAALVFFFRSQEPLRPTKHQAGRFWIKGCSPAYLADL